VSQLAKLNRNNVLFFVVDNRQIWENFLNVRYNLMRRVTNLTVHIDFLAQQDKWTRAMIKTHPSDEDAYWRHVSYIMAQLDGLHAGYSAAALPEWVTNYNHYNFVTYCGRER